MKLIITEKPSVARDIAKVLNITQKKRGYIEDQNYYVTWALGHLIEFCQPDEYAEHYKKWTFDDLPIIPEQFKKKVIERSQDQFEIVANLCKKDNIDEIICATDAGREGELIFRLIYDINQCKAPIKRLWISSQTDEAIKQGFSNLKPGIEYEPLYKSALSRAEADWLVGINATRAYSIKFSRGHGVMSVGRVQTPVLKMIVDRYLENTQFVSNPFYEIIVDANHENGKFSVKWFNEKDNRLFDKQEATDIANEVKECKTGKIISLTQKEKKEKQPLLYDLTEMQKDANKQFNYSADKTLKIMQDLYEKHKVLTYPRTSSRYLTKDMENTLPQLIKNLTEIPKYKDFANDIINNNQTIAKRMIDDSKVTDHHAIIPTNKKANISTLSEEHFNIFDLVIKRFLSAFMPECKKHHTEIICTFGQHNFKATGTIIQEPGWRIVYSENDTNPDKNKKSKEPEESLLPIVCENDPLQNDKTQLKESKTKAPPLYTEATILAAMETAGKNIDDDEVRQAMKNCGLGTPATRAQILEKLIKVNYITREKNKLTPTQKGLYIIENIQDEALHSPELTGEWEKKLNDISQSKYSRDDYMQEIADFTKAIIENVSSSQAYSIRADQKIYGSCPKCEKGKIIETPKAYSCTQWKDSGCKFAIWKLTANKTITEKQAETLLKKGITPVIKGFKSKAGNPFNAALKIIDGEVRFDFHKEKLGTCPECNGDIVETPKAFSCDNWRTQGCKFAIWKEIASRKTQKKEALELLTNGKTDVLEGFKTKTGKEITANLVLINNRVTLNVL
jgi:DNA topoisomerase III